MGPCWCILQPVCRSEVEFYFPGPCQCDHFSSVPDRKVQRRTEQARFNAAVVTAILEDRPGALVVVGGDLNVFPRPDEPIPDSPTDQLASLYDCGLKNIHDVLLAERPENAYTYIYKGQAQTLDHLFLTPPLMRRLVDARVLHINSDYPFDPAQPRRGCSDHDPVVAVFNMR